MTTAAAVREHPILFSGPMVRAILDGSKTQTRRVVKGEWSRALDACSVPTTLVQLPARQLQAACDCPYGQPGDRLWVRERHTFVADQFQITPGVVYDADGATRWKVPMPDGATVYNATRPEGWKRRPSIFLRREHARIVLELTDVRVERIRDISVADCRAEGAEGGDSTNDIGWRYSFGSTWNALNEKRGHGWDTNPWVWALTFRRVEVPA